MTLGEKIRELRNEKGWPQWRLSEAAGISVPYLKQIERGISHTVLSREKVTSITEALQGNVDEMLAERAVWELKARGYDHPIPEIVGRLVWADEETRQEVCELITSLVAEQMPTEAAS